MTDQSPDLTRFLACWPYTLAQEDVYPQDWTNPANFSDDPYDPGGATMDGIIQAEYNSYCSQHDLPQQIVRNITQAQGQDIYFNNFWLPHCPLVPVGLDLELFDANVNEGTKEGIKILQVALGIANDGIWGPQTDSAMKAITNLANVIKLFTSRRMVVYRETSGYSRFGADWIRRATEIGNQALAMISTTQPMGKVFAPTIINRVPRARWFIEGAAA